jgi:GH35 family endo-1,4-beta-xylanase
MSEKYAYLTDYKALKEYIDYSKYPNFKLGVGTDAADYANQGVSYVVSNANFTEVVAGNAMKMASCVDDNGGMNFGTVESFVNTAAKAGMNVYGHTLAWHAQQPSKWLNSLLADKVDPNYVPGAKTVVETEEEATCIRVVAGDMVDAAWDTQFWILTDATFNAGDTWEVSMKVRADVEASAGSQVHADPGSYLHWDAIGTVNFTTEWTTYTKTGTFAAEAAGGHSIAFNLNDFASANTYYFDEISFKVNGVEMVTNNNCDDPNGTANFATKESRGDVVPSRIVDHYIVSIKQESSNGKIALTDEEKKDTLTWAMERWISGMMDACKSEDGSEVLVKAWDVVNEAISGGNPDKDGAYALQHASDGGENDFFWQDYLGDLDYVRTAVRLARQYGGSDLKLFVNDYNLESDWDQNGKLKSLIKWIERWEADGRTKIDGIGSQMHISCYGNPATQESKKKAIENSFRLMAASGKLVRISELDMGYVDQYGNKVITADMTEEQHKEMAELYKWIVAKYLEIIPVAQQWGICQWCATDAPANSGWRGGEPVGLWDLDYYRKHTYAGFADGLAGK